MDIVMDIVMDILKGVLLTILGYALAVITRHLSYAFCFRSNVNKLDDEVKKLKDEKECLELNKLTQREEIENWQMRAGKAIEEAEELIKHGEEEAQKNYFARLFLDLKKRYDIGKKAEEKTSGIIQLQEERGRFVSISHRAPPQQILKPPVEGYEAESRKAILKEVTDALMDSDVNMVGVYGMGGIGKTTLAKEVHGQAERDKLFDVVIMAMVTATPEIRRIQGEIADMLGLKLDEETEVGRANRLYQSLSGRRILIILDDLWNMLELEKVGIPTRNPSGCKVLLTSRNLDVLSQMGSQKNFEVKGLLKEEARSLFEIKVAVVKDKKIAEEILDKCAGFPLLIVTVAGLLKNKELHIWKGILTQLSMFDNQEIQEKVYSVLELSYDKLPGDEAKLIFLLCGICGQSDTTILDLLKYSLGLGLFKHYSVENARNSLYKLMDDLKSNSLLLDIDHSGIVSMHDTVRDAAILIARRDQRVFRVRDAGDQLRVWPSREDLKNCNKICLPYCDIKELPEDLGCPEAEFFLFFSKGRPLHISDLAFQGINSLKVLCFSGMCFSPVPRSFCFLTNLHTLCLDGCQLRDIAIIGQLKKLQILSFRGAKLEELPSEIGELTQLKLLDLSYCSELRVIPSNVMAKLYSLEELLMRKSFNKWEMEEHGNTSNASLSELESLSNLSSLEIHVPNARTLPRNLFSKHLERYQILIGDVRYWNEDYKRSKTLKLKLNTDIDLLDRVKILLQETEHLYLDNMSKTRNVLPNLEIGGFTKLKQLEITDSFELQHIVDCTRRVTNGFSHLELLYLNRLTSLVKIWHGLPTPESFSKLRNLSVSNCNKLKNILNLSMVRSLSQLETMNVYNCSGMEGIVVDEGDCRFDGNEAVEFPRLQYLYLSNLPQLKGFVYKKKLSPVSETAVADYLETTSSYEPGTPLPLFDRTVAFPCLEQLHISSIDNIETICHNQTAIGSLSKLTSLSIGSCKKLETVFPSGILGSFKKLNSLEVWNCRLLEEIYRLQDLNVEKPSGPQTFELKTLSLHNLPKLKNVWRSTGRFFTFENLESINVERCGALKNLFPTFIAKSLQQLKTLCVESCGVEEMVAKEESGNNIPCFLFPHLTSLVLYDLTEMRSFYPRRHTLECPKLKDLTVSGCHKATMLIFESSSFQQTCGDGQHDILHQEAFFLAEKVFPNLEEMSIDGIFFKTMLQSPSWMQYLTKLRSLELSHFRGKLMTISQFGVFESIPNLREIVIRHSSIKELCRYTRVYGDETDSTTSSQPYIKILKLYSVKSLKHVWRQDSQMDPLLQYLERLELIFCEDLISLAPSLCASFQQLTNLEIRRCNQMINLMKPSIAKTMANLVKIIVSSCKELKEIVVADNEEDDDEKIANEGIVFNKLKTLQFYNLENLVGFCMSSCHSFQFPCLEEVSIEQCPIMRIFCHGDLDTPKLENINSRRLNRFEVNWQWEGHLNATIKQRYDKMLGLQQLQNLRLSRIPQLVERWHGQFPFEFFRSLSQLVVDKCALFSSAIPSNLLPFLNNLQKLVVEQCDSVEEVFDLDGLNATEGHVGLLSELFGLQLIQLPKLRHVWNKDPLGILGIRNLRELEVHCCGSLTNIFTLPIAVGLVHLRYLEVKECVMVEVIIKKEGEEEANWDHKTIFPSLWSIKLEHLPNLVNFCSGGRVLRCPSLRKVNVVGCPMMPIYDCSSSSKGKQVPSTIVQRHEERPLEGSVDHMPTLCFFNGQVEVISLEELVVEWNSAVNEIWHTLFPAPFFYTLEGIQLTHFPAELSPLPSGFSQSLPNLKKFVMGNSFSEQIFPKEVNTVKEIQPVGPFAQLQKLKLFNLPNLKHLVEEDSQLGSLFQHLKKLKVIKCSGLARLITSSTAKGLVNLQKMVVKECERMIEIVASEANEVKTNGGLNQLQYLELHGLPCLTSFSSNCTFNFPCLEEVIVRECPKMAIFAQHGLISPLLDEVEIGEDEDAWHWEGSLNNTIEKLFLEMNVQDVKEDEVALSCT